MSRQLSRQECLLILRVVATVAVVFGHAASYFVGFSITQWPSFPYIQNVAVVLFFAVSGWTIAWVIDSRQRYTFGRFLFDRFTRLAIPLIPILAILAVIEALYFDVHPYAFSFTARNFLGNAALLQNLTADVPWIGPLNPGVTPFGLSHPLWTISLEFWIYVAFGGFVFATRRHATWLPLALSLVGGSLIANSVFGGRGAGLPLIWLAGAALYYAQRETATLTWRARVVLLPPWAFVLHALTQRSLWAPEGDYSAMFNLVIFANFALFMVVVPGLSVPTGVVRVSNWFGAFAYTTYLVHYPLMYIVRDIDLFGVGRRAVVVATIGSFAVAWVVSLLFEQRYRAIRDWLWTQLHRWRRPAVAPAD